MDAAIKAQWVCFRENLLIKAIITNLKKLFGAVKFLYFDLFMKGFFKRMIG